MKKTLSLLLALVLCLSLCACGTSPDKPTERPTESMDDGLGNALPKELSKYFGEWTWEENIYPNNYANHTVIIEASGVGSVHGVNGTWRYEQPDGLTFYVTSTEGEEVSVAFFDFIDSAHDGNTYLYGNVFAEDALRFGIDGFGEETVKGELYKDGPDYRYNSAVYKLNQLVADSQTSVSLTEEDATYLIDVFTALGDYKDSCQILDLFSVFPNMPSSIVEIAVDKIGNETKTDKAFYQYDSNGRIISTSADQIREEFGLLAYCFPGKLVFSYDENGAVNEIVVNHFGEMLARCTPQYNEWGAIVSVHILTNNGELSANFEYDAQNRLISSRIPNSNYYSGDTREFTYTYNDVGQLIEKDMYCSGLYYRVVTTYTYEGETLISAEEIETRSAPFDTTPVTTSYAYSYTQDGRIEKVAIITDDPSAIYATREWVYNYSNLYFYTPKK